MRTACVGILLFVAASVGAAEPNSPVRITGETKYKPHSLVRLRAEGVDPKAAILWRVHPAKDVQRATTPRGVLEFAAHPATYEIELLVIRQTDDGLVVDESQVTVTIEGCGPVPPAPEPKPQDANVRAATEELERVLGTRVRIVELNGQRGRIEIEYFSQEELQRLYERITSG